MIIRVSDIPDEGLAIEDATRFPARTGAASRLEAVRLHIGRDGEDVVVQGEVTASASLQCSRCLESFPLEVRASVDARLAPRPPVGAAVELGPDDLDVDFYEHDQVDLGALVDTETILALPMKALCREDCRGLCPACGSNRNLVRCACDTRPPDPRLAVLSDLAARLHQKG
ncbi:MAG: DUF177 domain-containing protein [Candidatus Rokubacteria bacterium]|nr:DUF177 domain-containing protein [Candidatus Rokubacteria bacterium]MBI3826189.1 DUF177 domain-containing protein [Candidatus Rokubacteria bacterium]